MEEMRQVWAWNRTKLGNIVPSTYLPQRPKASKTRTFGVTVKGVSLQPFIWSSRLADASGFALVGDPARIHLVV
jgi:hypothetical protein